MSHTRRFEAGRRRSGVRGAASIFFAVVFLFVGIVHAASNSGVPLPASQLQISVSADNTDNSEDKADAVAIFHYVYCAGIVLPTEVASPVIMTVESTFELFSLACLSPHDPTFQTPPPKSSI